MISRVINYHPTNFAIVDKFLMRSSQPSKQELEFLVSKDGVTDIFNLSGDTPEMVLKQEEKAVKKFGLGYFKIPSVTDNPLQENIENFLQKTVELKKLSDRKALVHCNAGIDRTGTYVVFYQLFNRLKNINDAIKEMIEKGHCQTNHPELIPRIKILAQKMKLV